MSWEITIEGHIRSIESALMIKITDEERKKLHDIIFEIMNTEYG